MLDKKLLTVRRHTPENNLLLICARTRLNESLMKRVRFLANNIELDWEILFQVAVHHRLFPLLYKSLNNCCLDLVPDHIYSKMRSFFVNNAVRNCYLANTLLTIITLFKEHNIYAVPFKGPILTATVYGDLPLRIFGDLDILIEQRDLEKAIQLLKELGYTSEFDLPIEKFLKLVRKGHHANLVNLKNGIVVELHWEMSGRYCSRNLDLDFVRPRLKSALLLDQSVANLGTEDLLLYLCIHGNRHRWRQLDAVCCIAELIREQPGMDWGLTIKLAERLGAVRILLLGIVLANRILGAKLSTTMLKAIENEQALAPLATQIEKVLFDPNTEQREIMYHLRGLVFHSRTIDNLSDGIKYGAKKICMPDGYDLEWVALPSSLWLLYSVLRPLRFAVEYGLEKCKGKE